MRSGPEIAAPMARTVVAIGLSALTVLLSCTAEQTSRTAAPADTILFNGKVITLDDDGPAKVTIAEAVAVRDGKILAVGGNAKIRDMAASGTKQVDLGGRAVIPGLIDTHSHLYEWSLDFPWAEQWTKGLRKVGVEATTVDDAVAKARGSVRGRAAEVGRGKWVIVDVRPPDVAHAALATLSRTTLDEWAPDNPTIVRTRASALLNTLAIGSFERFYGQEIPQEYWIVDKARGWSSNYVDFPRCARIDQILADDLPGYARILRSVMQVNAQTAVTTHATHAQCINGYRVGRLMDQAGDLPIRWAWSEGWAHTFNPRPEEYYERAPDVSGTGSPFFFSIGVNPVNLDGGGIAMCTTIPAPPKVKEREVCPDKGTAESLRLRALQTMWKSGLRVAGHHVAGDKALDAFLDALANSGRTPDEIRALRPVADHCHLVRADQIERAKRLGVNFSCAAALEESAVVAKDYGTKFLSWVVPARSMLEAGMRPAMSQFGSEQKVRLSPFEDAYAFLTRRSVNGRPFGVPEQAITDRMTLLLMMSRWAAPNILKEKELGSIEPGKWADLVVLEADPLGGSPQQFATIRPLLTMVGGKIVFEDTAFRGNTLRFNPFTAEWEKRIVTE